MGQTADCWVGAVAEWGGAGLCGRGLPLQLVVPEVAGVEEVRLVGDILLQGVGQRQAG